MISQVRGQMTEPTPAHTQVNGRREAIAILDYGSQYSRLIARRVREARVYCELLPATATLADIQALGAKGVILSGGPDSVYDNGARSVDQAILESGLPVLGVCYGMQLSRTLVAASMVPPRSHCATALMTRSSLESIQVQIRVWRCG
jgi:carbamoylphosphate synthase small subunit